MENDGRIAWRVIDKHLDGAEMAMSRFDAALSSPHFTLDTVAKGPELQLLAQIDGLVVAGTPVVDTVLAPALAAKRAPASNRAAALVIALLSARRPEIATRALSHESNAVRRAAVRGCALAAGTTLDDWIVQSLGTSHSPVPRATLLDLAAERGLAIDSLGSALLSEKPEELLPAIRLAQSVDTNAHQARLLALMHSQQPGIRDAAMVTLLHHGSSMAWSTCVSLALDSGAPSPLAMTLLAGLGEPADHNRLAELAAWDAHRASVLRALAVSGNVTLVPLLLHYAQSRDVGAADLAKDALATIVGPEITPLLAEPIDRAAVERWWTHARGRFDSTRRYLAGVPANRATFCSALTYFPTSRRYPLSLVVSIRSGGAERVSTRAFTATQLSQIATLGGRGDEPWKRQLSTF